MKTFLLAALTIGAVSSVVAPTSGPVPSPPLCRVVATAQSSLVPFLTTVTVSLRPDCPPDGHANVRLESDLGSSDPPGTWLTLTPCSAQQARSCSYIWRGVLLRPLGWHPQWRSASGRVYAIPLSP